MAEFCAYDWGVRFNPILLSSLENSGKLDKKTLVQNLKILAESKDDIGDCCKDNEFLERFLKARKYVFNESCDLYTNYYTFKLKNPEIFNRLNGQDVLIQQALRDGFPGVLEKRDRRGRCILLFIASRWNCNCYSLQVIFRSLWLTLELLLDEKINQERGFVFIIDWSELSYKQSTYLSPKVLKLIIEGLQDCFPAKFKGIHFVSQPWYVEVALTVIKPFLKEKSKNRIHTHGNNLSTLHQFIPKDILPADLGGEDPPFNPLSWAKTIMNMSVE